MCARYMACPRPGPGPGPDPWLQFGMGTIDRGKHQISNLFRRLVEPITHAIAAQTLAHDVELQPETMD